ncbi:GSCFA domain-containing protein [Tabrizicola sp.]|uniref:GSCFA domain-containing protein n=1 Tax=Tabrizicola sp. TaxID=2005166 RepID=UPI00286BC62B|nr:GSCFA domain-containing protein [Tabrizicola sp.]
MPHPYEDLPPDRYWRTGVADVDVQDIAGLWKPRLHINSRTRIVTAGSCFAQHFSRALVARGYRWMNLEPGPATLTPAQRHDYHYGTFSFRTGNIYTPRMLRQWLTWALERVAPPEDVWETGGRFFDPFRPAVEPDGFASVEELRASREVTLEAIRQAVATAHVFVFTMGLTEAWQNRHSGTEYAVCPGTIAGEFDPETHVFVNHRFAALLDDMTAVLRLLAKANRRLNVLLTVSPVPLTATASGQHVLAATSHSKSLLRAVASELMHGRPRVDYFPSYEIITHPVYRGQFFAPNLRSVLPEGVDHVMRCFFRDIATQFNVPARPDVLQPEASPASGSTETEAELTEAEELRCEEEILAAFAPR